MNLKHLNDAFDYTKKGVLVDMADGCVIALHDLLVLPMLTDEKDWGEHHYRRYAEILGVPPNAILRENPFQDPSTGNVSAYFCDPDTGIEPLRSRATKKHARGNNLKYFLEENPDALIIVYQHGGRRGSMRTRLMEANTVLRSSNLCSLGLDLGQIGFVFCALTEDRLEPVKRHYGSAMPGETKERLIVDVVPSETRS